MFGSYFDHVFFHVRKKKGGGEGEREKKKGEKVRQKSGSKKSVEYFF